MKGVRLPVLFLMTCILFCSSGTSSAQTISTEGRDFWIGFMNNWLQDPGNPIILEIYLSSKDTTRATLNIPLSDAWGPLEVDIFPNRATKVTVPTDIAMAEGSGIIQNKGIHILSDDNISVYAMNKRQWSADITVVLPAISLGKNYLATAHWEPGNRNGGANSQAEILVLSIADSTEIVIDPSVDLINGNFAHEPFSVFLDRGQVFQIQANADLSGTHIYSLEGANSSCNNFAVFAGNRYTKVGQCDHPDGHDHLYAQMYPTNTWGKSFITIPLQSRSGGDYFKLLASKDSTEIAVNNQHFLLNEGEVILITLDQISSIEANYPISVVQFSRSQACDNSTSDPFMIVVSPKEQLLDQVTFNAPPGNNLNFYFMNVVAKTSDIGNIFLDNIPMFQYFNPVPFDNIYSFAQIPIFEGNHTLRSNQGFIAYVYGYGSNESFGFATGASLENLLVIIDITDTGGSQLPDGEACRFEEVKLTARTDESFTDFFWDFGDSQTSYTDQPETTHEYQESGNFQVKVVASIGIADCALGGSETSFRRIRVVKPLVDILGPRSVCPNTEDVLYRADGDAGNQYVWDVLGGTIAGESYLDSIRVNWGATNNMAQVSLFPVSKNDCPGDTTFHQVKINVQLDPEAPFGPDSLCSTDISGISYFAYETNGSQYQWEISNGVINEGQGTHEIDLSWSSPGNGELWFLQSSSIDSICAGMSDTLNVFIERAPSDSVILNLSAESLNIGQVLYASLEADSIFQWVNWEIPGLTKKDTALIEEGFQWEFLCQGNYQMEAVLFDTLGLCNASTKVSRPFIVEDPGIEIINVSHALTVDSTLEINFKMENMTNFPKPVLISRMNFLPQPDSWAELGLLTSDQETFFDRSIPTNLISFAYRISANEDCGDGLTTPPHNSILLEGNISDGFELYWNQYNNWPSGVEAYEVWKDVDKTGYELMYSGSELNYTYEYSSEGFEICFRIRAVEQNGNESESWSNQVCGQFFPELTPYNVFSPNGDQWNQCFVIEGIQMYPNSTLIIFNRYGRTVFKETGYGNDWQGTSQKGDLLAAGVYYWTLQLNEPRVEVEYIRGEVSILY